MLKDGYFYEMRKKTPTRPWINTAIQEELETAIRWGAVANTMNPTHPPKAIKADRKIWQPVIDNLLKSKPDISDDDAVDFINQSICKRSAQALLSFYKESKGKYGYAAIQSNPNTNDDLSILMKYAISYSKIAVNAIPKIPCTKVGAEAIVELTAKGINTIVTMGFSVSQGIYIAEAYERGLNKRKSNSPKPRCFFVIIPGVFLDYLKELVQSKSINIAPEVLNSAGIILTRLVYKLFKERKYQADLIVGGTRNTSDITSFVGGELHITHSFNTWKQLTEENPPVISRIFDQTSSEVILELKNKFEDFRKACEIDGLSPDEFRSYGPCLKFNNSLVEGYSKTRKEIQESRLRLQEKKIC